jgi:hypothetical protein
MDVYENNVDPDWPQMIYALNAGCLMLHTPHSQYVILIVFPRQQLLRELACYVTLPVLSSYTVTAYYV